MKRFALLLFASTFLTHGCSSTPECIVELTSDPAGAQVYLSRRGERAYRGDLVVVDGDVRAEELTEDFLLVGTTPLQYSTLLEETESGGTVLGVGASVVRKYREGLLRVELDGYEVAERHMRLRDGELSVHVSLEKATPEGAQP